MSQQLSVRIDTRELADVFAKIKAVSPQLPAEYRKALKTATLPAVAAVKSSASWSTRIPGAVGTRVLSGRNARIEIFVNGKKAPEAAPLDNRGRTGTFRRPVFADAALPRSEWTWVDQPARPFLEGPVAAHLPQVETGLLDATMNVLRKAGFR